MPVRSSHGRDGAENFRADELPDVDPAALSAPAKDPLTGRFRPGNPGGRLKQLAKHARSLPWLDETKVEPWLRPFVIGAKEHALDLLESLPPGNPLLSPVAEELAAARVIYRAMLAKGLEGDAQALESARAWLRECRQHALALEGLARKPLNKAEGDNAAPPPWLVFANKAQGDEKP